MKSILVLVAVTGIVGMLTGCCDSDEHRYHASDEYREGRYHHRYDEKE